MWTFKTQCLGEIVISSKRFASRKEAWQAAVDWADIAYVNGEVVVSISVIAIPK